MISEDNEAFLPTSEQISQLRTLYQSVENLEHRADLASVIYNLSGTAEEICELLPAMNLIISAVSA